MGSNSLFWGWNTAAGWISLTQQIGCARFLCFLGFLQATESTMVLTPKQQQWKAIVLFGVGIQLQVGYF